MKNTNNDYSQILNLGSLHEEIAKEQERKKGRTLPIIMMIISLILIGSGVFYPQISKLIETNKNDKDKNHSEDGDDTFSVDFQKLLEINPDTIAWIRFPDEPSQINYPVVQGTDNSKYLKKTFSSNENTLGAIFLNVDNQKDFSDKNSVIYGHRMRDGSMFRHLQDYDTREFWKNNPYFYIYTVDGRILKYHIYSAGQVVDTSESYQTTFETDEEYQEFLNMTQSTSLYNTGVEVTTADTIVTLSTCTSASDNHRFVVRGVKEEETKQ